MMPPTRTRVRTSAAMRYAEQQRESFDAIKGTYPSDHMDILRKEASSMDHGDDDVPTALGSYVVEPYGSEATGAPNGARMDLDQVNLDVDNNGARAPRAGLVNSSTRFLLLRRTLGKKISGEELKTAQMSLFLFVYYLVWNWFRFDSLFAASTLAIYEDALSKLPGVSATSSPYCSHMPDGVFRDLHSGEKCVLAFRDAIEVDDLYNFLTTELLDIPGALFEVCENCAMSITQSPKGIQVLTEADFICTDSDVHEFGTAELTTKPSCMLDELIGQPGSIDYEWAANPTTLTAPCCNNATLILASMLLLSRSSLSGGGVAADDLADLMLMNANRLNELIAQSVAFRWSPFSVPRLSQSIAHTHNANAYRHHTCTPRRPTLRLRVRRQPDRRRRAPQSARRERRADHRVRPRLRQAPAGRTRP